MNSMLHWQAAKARSAELRRLEAATDAHPFARFVWLTFRPKQTHR
jgi:hypothetical protein